MNLNEACVVFTTFTQADKDIRIVKVSNNFEDVLGFRSEDILGSYIDILMPEVF